MAKRKILFMLILTGPVVFSTLFHSPPDSAAQPTQELKPGEGREVVAAQCLGCHDAGLITAPEMSRSQWDRTITEMVEDQGMVEPSTEVRRIILDYLVETQSPKP